MSLPPHPRGRAYPGAPRVPTGGEGEPRSDNKELEDGGSNQLLGGLEALLNGALNRVLWTGGALGCWLGSKLTLKF